MQPENTARANRAAPRLRANRTREAVARGLGAADLGSSWAS
jgi:hypothetical protein